MANANDKSDPLGFIDRDSLEGYQLERIAIVNRGEAAIRLIRAVRELNFERHLRLATVALYTEPDRQALFVHEADDAVCIGPATFIDQRDGKSKSCYLDLDRIEQALVTARVDMAWAGWSLLAEEPRLADICERLGIVFVGPDAATLRLLSDQIRTRRLVEQVNIPVVPWSGKPIETEAEARHQAEQLGYPLVIKPAFGSQRGRIHRVLSPAELASAFEFARDEARHSFNDPAVFLERVIDSARRIEVQVIADRYGTTRVAGVIDCTVQHHSQWLLEESSSPALLPEQERRLREVAVHLCHLTGYQNAGSVVFLFRPDQNTFWFLEFSASLSAAHPVTEITAGIDLVKLQLDLARGVRLEGEPPAASGHAIAAHLFAMNWDNDFTPGTMPAGSKGRLEVFRLAGGPGLRIDTGYAQGDSIHFDSDPLLAKITAWGRDRQEALARLRCALNESTIVIRGGISNKSLLLDLLTPPVLDSVDPDLSRGERSEANQAGTNWFDRLLTGDGQYPRQYAEVALLQAAVEAYDEKQRVEQAEFYASAARGRPKVRQGLDLPIDFRYLSQGYRLEVSRLGPQYYRVTTDSQRIEVRVERLGPFQRRITCFGHRYRVLSVIDGTDYFVEVEGIPHRMTLIEGGIVRTPAPAVVVSVNVAPGHDVEAGQQIAVIEVMKMEMSITAPFSGRVARLFVTSNVQVDAGAPLVQIAPFTWDDKPDSNRVQFRNTGHTVDLSEDNLQLHCRTVLEALRCQMLGYDSSPDDARQLLNELSTISQLIAPGDQELLRGENEILAVFADTCSLFRRELDPAEANAQGEQVHSTEQDLLTYLRFRDINTVQQWRLPTTFLVNLRRALAHYGVGEIHPSPELDESLLLIYKSHQNVNQQLATIITVLERRLTHVDELAISATEDMRALLDQLLQATQRRYQAVNDLAREMRFRYFDEPLFKQAMNRVYEEMQAHLAYLSEHPLAPDRDERIRHLVDCPQPLQNLLTSRFPESDDQMRQIMLEVLTRRYYRIRWLKNVECTTVDGQTIVKAAYDYNGASIVAVTTFARYEDLAAAATTLGGLIRQIPHEHDIVIDFYLWRSEPLGEAETTEQEIRSILNRTSFALFLRPLRRIVVAVSAAGKGLGIASSQHFTYRSGENGYQEEQLYRGLHPMMGKRLHIWRLSNFKVERLSSVEDVYLFHGIAHDNPNDERLFALAEVRDVTPQRDESGRVIQIPHLERMLTEALDSIRLYQSHLPADKHLPWNRVLLYVWPPLGLQPEEFLEIMRKLWPATEGLGLERIVLHAKITEAGTGELRDCMLHISNPGGRELVLRVSPPIETPIATLSEYRQKVVQLRQRGLVYPYELIEMLTPEPEGIRTQVPPGDFTEYDLDKYNQLVPVNRPYGKNKTGIVVGVIRNYTARYAEGMTRVILLGDPSRGLGSVAEPECRRIIEAINLAERLQVPIEWFAVSAGARISMDSGTENMDWVAKTLRRIIEFTQAGGEINVIVNGINVGAQPYWNAEATMLMHAHGILIMTPNGAMVLTGKQSLDYSGGVSAEDNYGIGGYERIMGPNGQAQYFASDLGTACQILMRHYDHTYVIPGERFPRRVQTGDPATRDVRAFPYSSTQPEEHDLTCVGDLFSDEKNADRKRAFDIRTVMAALIDADQQPLERWGGMRNADTVVVWDAHIGGYPVAMLGIESRPIPRRGFVPGDGPEQWTAGTLFPMSSKKAARAINSASGNRPLVVIANLSGFDGSPESLRNLQLEYGAEIGRAITNFKGPIIFCVISRYHGGAFVDFSKALNEQIEVAALEGSYASVIGGVPAAAVVFAREVDTRTRADPRVKDLQEQIAQANVTQKAALRIKLNEATAKVHAEKVGEIASEFDHTHNVQRAQRVGSIDHVIPSAVLRPYLIEALERGIRRELQRITNQDRVLSSE